MTLQPGTRVHIKSLDATGVIVYSRMAPPTYSKVEVYSVKLDNKQHTGTIVKAEDVEIVKE